MARTATSTSSAATPWRRPLTGWSAERSPRRRRRSARRFLRRDPLPRIRRRPVEVVRLREPGVGGELQDDLAHLVEAEVPRLQGRADVGLDGDGRVVDADARDGNEPAFPTGQPG